MKEKSTQVISTTPKYAGKAGDRTPVAQEHLNSQYVRIAVDIAQLGNSLVQVLVDIPEVMQIAHFSREQLENILKREEATKFLRTKGGDTRVYLARFILFLHREGGEYIPAAERLYGVYLSRSKR